MIRIWVYLSGMILPLLLSTGTGICADNLTRNSARECAICHFRWIDQFVQGHGTVLAPLEIEDVAGTELMCLSCHDGSTDDSRKKVWILDRHKTGVVPSDRVNIPKLFPLSRQGEIVCATCHSAHGVPTDTSIERTIFLRISDKDSIICEMCHQRKTETTHNHPLHTGDRPLPDKLVIAGAVPSSTDRKHVICESCHTAHGGVERNLILPAGNSQLCITCHDQRLDQDPTSAQHRNHPLFVSLKKNRLTADQDLFTGAGSSLQCLTCHQLHKKKEVGRDIPVKKDATRFDYILVEPQSDSSLCLYCHVDKTNREDPVGKTNHPIGKVFKQPDNGEPFYQGKDGSLQCRSCHRPHQAAAGSKGLVRTRKELCGACHIHEAAVTGTDHDLRVTGPDAAGDLLQGAEEIGVCASCHAPHQAKGKKYLWARQEAQQGSVSESSSALCLGCHQQGQPATKKTLGRFSHPYDKKFELSIDLPLETAPDGSRLIQCHTCHDPHQWRPGDSSPGTGYNEEGDESTSFLRKSNRADALLCKECHPRQYLVTGTDHDMRITAPDSVNGKGKKPNQHSVCVSCHSVHNAQYETVLWNSPLAITKGNDFMEKTCYGCHSENGAGQSKRVRVGSHPRRVYFGYHLPYSSTLLDDPASPDGIPLFLKNGRSAATGEISCPTCHSPHLWQYGQTHSGNGKNVEGSTVTSFLRKDVRKKLCYECHGMKTLFLYRYYHEEAERKRLMKPYSPGF